MNLYYHKNHMFTEKKMNNSKHRLVCLQRGKLLVMLPCLICHLAVCVSFHYICFGFGLLSGNLLCT